MTQTLEETQKLTKTRTRTQKPTDTDDRCRHQQGYSHKLNTDTNTKYDS